MGTYITTADMEDVLPKKLLLEIFDDNLDGIIDATKLELYIKMGEAEVKSQLMGFYTMPLTTPLDDLVRLAAFDYTIHFIYERNAAAVQQFGDGTQLDRYKRAEERMQRVQSALKRLTENSPSNGPKNIGGVIYDVGPRLLTDSTDGTYNGGDF